MDKQFHGVVSKDGMGAMRFAKASISGREVSCDVCGRVVPREKIRSIYFGEHGEKIDYCEECLG
jgi:hypothetical protein